MKTSTLKFHLGESLKSLKRNGWMSVAAISAVSVTLLLVGIFLTAVMNINKISSDIEGDVRVRVSIQKDATEQQKATLKDQLQSTKGVQKVTYSSRDNELKKLVKVYGDAFSMFKGDANPLNDLYIVSTKDPAQTKQVANRIQKYRHISEVDYGGKQAKQLFNIMGGIRQVALIFAVILLLVAIFLIANTIRITIISRRNEIEIMQLVGATNSFIRTPFLFEGAWTGIFGSILPIIIVDLSYRGIFGQISMSFANSGYQLLSPGQILLWLDLLLVLIGAVIGALGSLISIRRYLKLS